MKYILSIFILLATLGLHAQNYQADKVKIKSGGYLMINGVPVYEISNDPTLADSLATALVTEAAVKAYVAGLGGTDDQTAVEVPNTPAGNISSTNVQAAINELDTEKLATSALLSTLLGVDGAGSALDADLLDGQQGSYYLDLDNAMNAIATSQIEDDAVTLAKQASGTANRVQGWDASGNPAEYTAGSNITISGGQISASGGISGLTTNYLPKATSGTTIGDSQVFDNGTNVGIGTASPSVKLHVLESGAGGVIQRLYTNGAANPLIFFGGDVDGSAKFANIGLDYANSIFSMSYGSGENDHLVINSSGNVGIGTATVSDKMSINGNVGVMAGNMLNLYSDTGGGVSNIENQSSSSSDITMSFGSSGVFKLNYAGNAGIGTSTPVNKLDIEGGAAIGALYSGTSVAPTDGVIVVGNVGIGTSSPSEKLEVVGTIYSNQAGNSGKGTIRMGTSTDATNKYSSLTSTQYSSTAEPEGFQIISALGSVTDNEVRFGGGLGEFNAPTLIRFFTASNTSTRSGTEAIRINSSGNVGIGTTTPSTKLEVSGEVKINTINNASTDTDKFLVGDAGTVKHRTGTQLVGDVGFLGSSFSTTMTSAVSNDTLINTSSDAGLFSNVPASSGNIYTISYTFDVAFDGTSEVTNVFSIPLSALGITYGTGEEKFIIGTGTIEPTETVNATNTTCKVISVRADVTGEEIEVRTWHPAGLGVNNRARIDIVLQTIKQ